MNRQSRRKGHSIWANRGDVTHAEAASLEAAEQQESCDVETRDEPTTGNQSPLVFDHVVTMQIKYHVRSLRGEIFSNRVSDEQ